MIEMPEAEKRIWLLDDGYEIGLTDDGPNISDVAISTGYAHRGLDPRPVSVTPYVRADIADEMLEALKEMANRFEKCLVFNGTDPEYASEAVASARSAIAKAEEEPI